MTPSSSLPRRRARRAAAVAFGLAAALAATLAARDAAAQTGSGTVSFTFTSFAGPIATALQADALDPTKWALRGRVDEQHLAPTGWVTQGDLAFPDFGYVLGATSFAAPLTSLALRYDAFAPGEPTENIVAFTPHPFTNVALGQDFVLGTLTFQNGSWFGGGVSGPAFNTPSDLGFRIVTTSASGPAFNQTIDGVIRLVVNAPLPNDVTTLAGQEAEADWIYIDSPAVVGSLGAFRVFDDCCKPAGATNHGTVDVIARFNSLDLVALANAQGGFVTDAVTPLPPVVPGTVPEPGTWMLLAAGLALLAGRRGRRTLRVLRLACGALVLAAPLAADAQTGSGTVTFTFTTFSGPMALADVSNVNNPSAWSPYGLVNGVIPTVDDAYPAAPGASLYELHGQTTFAPGATAANLVEWDPFSNTAIGDNLISFTAHPFTNVTVGQDFVLGTLTFRNSIWFGQADPTRDRQTHLGFRITTTSGDGAAFNQVIEGTITMAVNAVDASIRDTPAGWDAEADWIYVDSPAVVGSMGSFRVYDACCHPPGFTNEGTVDVIARFNSLDLVGFANPQGGFVNGSVLPLPPGSTATVPEPATWALVAGGVALLGARRRRTRVA